MIVNVNPTAADFDETQHVLSYAVVARNVKINAADYRRKVNVMSSKGSKDGEPNNERRKKRGADEMKECTAAKKIAKLAAKLSPRTLMAKRREAMKRSATEQSDSTASASSKDLSKQKLENLLEKSSKLEEANQNLEAEVDSYKRQVSVIQETAMEKSSTLEQENRILQDTVETLKGQLSASITEVSWLKDELANKESEIRAEVAEEFDEQIAKIRDHYEGMRKQQEQQQDGNVSTLMQSTRKIQQDRAEQLVDDLVDKIEECEDELERMRQSHKAELEKLAKSREKALREKDAEIDKMMHFHTVILAAKDAEIEKLKLEIGEPNDDDEYEVSDEAGSPDVNTGDIDELDDAADHERRNSDMDNDADVNDDKQHARYSGPVHPSKENVSVERVPKDDSAPRMRLLRQNRCSEVACEIRTTPPKPKNLDGGGTPSSSKTKGIFKLRDKMQPQSTDRIPLSQVSKSSANVNLADSEFDNDEQDASVRMRLRSRTNQRQ